MKMNLKILLAAVLFFGATQAFAALPNAAPQDTLQQEHVNIACAPNKKKKCAKPCEAKQVTEPLKTEAADCAKQDCKEPKSECSEECKENCKKEKCENPDCNCPVTHDKETCEKVDGDKEAPDCSENCDKEKCSKEEQIQIEDLVD